MAYNKIIYAKKVLIDLTLDTVDANAMFSGATAYNKSGKKVTGGLFKNYPTKVTIRKVSSTERSSIKEKNIVRYNGKTLLNISSSTVKETSLLWGFSAHDKSGKIINGTFLKNHPTNVSFNDVITDSSNNPITDQNGETITSEIVYKKTSTTSTNVTYERT